MKELRIYDKNADTALVSFSKLVKILNEMNNTILTGQWFIHEGAYGYGKMVCEIEDALEDVSKILVN